jgi:hypothetical protein
MTGVVPPPMKHHAESQPSDRCCRFAGLRPDYMDCVRALVEKAEKIRK